MKVEQIYQLVNNITGELLGTSELILEDLSNVVDVGTQILDGTSVDNYVKTLVNHIGRVVFVNRPYVGSAPSVLMDAWEYGSIKQKITAKMPKATENESWELVDGETYNQDIFTKPDVSNKFFNSLTTFEIPCSFTELQVRESFSSASQLNAFFSMIYTAIDNSLNIKTEAMIMRTINNFSADTISDGSALRAINLLAGYNAESGGTALTAEQAVKNPDFIRYASYMMGVYTSRLSTISTLFNIGGQERFTPSIDLHVIMLADFMKAANVYLQSDVWHNDLTKLPEAETVPYWQASGNDYAFNSISSINVKTSSGNTVNQSGILAVMFDREALGVSNMNKRVTSHYNAKAEFFNNWYKEDCAYFNDHNENFVVFYVA